MRLPVLADSATAPGTAFMAFAQKGDVGPNDLVDLADLGDRVARGDAARRPRASSWSRTRFSRNGLDTTVVLIVIGKTLAVFVLLLLSVLMYIWFLRKVIAGMQNRIGLNPPAGPFGLFQTAADGIKLFKEQSQPRHRRSAYLPDRAVPRGDARGPRASSIVPIGGLVTVDGYHTYLQLRRPGHRRAVAADDVGHRSLPACMLAGWSSGSKYPLLGSVRASAQLLSYEAALGLAIVGVLVHSGTLSTRAIVNQQAWVSCGLVRHRVVLAPRIGAFVIFVITAMATNHPPFDLVEAEQELVGGFHTEYTGIRFTIFFLAEFMNLITMCTIAVTLFLGGPSGPALGFLGADNWINVWVMPVLYFTVKVLILLCTRRSGCGPRCLASATTS